MHLHFLKIFFLFLITNVVSLNLNAQLNLSSHFDIGENNVSEGVYLRNSCFADYQIGKMTLHTGVQLDIINVYENVITGTTFKLGREFPVERFPFEVEGLIIYNPFSDWVHEFNWGLLAKIERTHFTFKLGTNFRIYSLTQKAIDHSGAESNEKIHENWNIMYLAQYYFKPVDNIWNAGISITNTDYFLLNQESNPMFNLNGRYNITKPLTLYAEAWYKPSGMLNISVNYFGFFIRTGIIWKIDLNK